MATTTVIATAVIPISQLRRECANKFAGRIKVSGYPCSAAIRQTIRFDRGISANRARGSYSGPKTYCVDVHNCSDHAALR